MKKLMMFIFVTLIIILFFFIYFMFFYKVDNDMMAWYNNNQYIGHALYGIDGCDYVNSSDSLEYGYSKGIRVMEVDLLYTSDNELVVNHDWEYGIIKTYDEFMNNKIYGKYSPIDMKMLVNYMIKYRDLYLVIDTKEDSYNEDNYLNLYRDLIDYCKNLDENILDRIIIQIYDYDMYSEIDKMYHFDNYIFSIYKLVDKFNILQLVHFCISNNIDVIGIPKGFIDGGIIKDNFIKFMKGKNIKLYVYTINNDVKYREYLSMGIDGIYTDFLY